jgi:hypothetical protein
MEGSMRTLDDAKAEVRAYIALYQALLTAAEIADDQPQISRLKQTLLTLYARRCTLGAAEVYARVNGINLPAAITAYNVEDNPQSREAI